MTESEIGFWVAYLFLIALALVDIATAPRIEWME
jgi:hypothetical protein